jgi:hypothetical protein
MNRCSDGDRLDVDQRGPPGDPGAFAAQVTVVTSQAERTQIVNGPRALGQGPSRAHFGLGDDSQVLDVVVLWPDGTTTRTGPVDADAWLRVYHPAAP